MDYNTPIRPYTGNQLPSRRPAVAGQTQGRDNRYKVPTARQAFQQTGVPKQPQATQQTTMRMPFATGTPRFMNPVTRPQMMYGTGYGDRSQSMTPFDYAQATSMPLVQDSTERQLPVQARPTPRQLLLAASRTAGASMSPSIVQPPAIQKVSASPGAFNPGMPNIAAKMPGSMQKASNMSAPVNPSFVVTPTGRTGNTAKLTGVSQQVDDMVLPSGFGFGAIGSSPVALTSSGAGGISPRDMMSGPVSRGAGQAPATPPSMSQQRPPVAPAIDARNAIPLAAPATPQQPPITPSPTESIAFPRDGNLSARPMFDAMINGAVPTGPSLPPAVEAERQRVDSLNQLLQNIRQGTEDIAAGRAAPQVEAREAFAQTMDQARNRGIDTASTQAGFRPGELEARAERAREMFTSPTGYTVPGTNRVVARDGVLMTPGQLGGNYPMTAAEERLQAAEEARRTQVTAAPRLTPDQMTAFTNANTLNFDGVDMTGRDADAIMNARYQQRLAENPVADNPVSRREQLLAEQMQRRAVRAGIYEPGRTTADYRNMFAEAEANEQLMPRQEAELALRQDRANRMMSQMPGVFTPEQQESIAASANPLVGARAALAGVRDTRRQQAAEANARSVMMNNLAMRDPRAFANLAAANTSAEARMAMNQADNATRMNVTEREASARETIAGNQLTQADLQFQARQESERLQHAERMAQLEATNKSATEIARLDREFQAQQQRDKFAYEKEMEELRRNNPRAMAEDAAAIAQAQVTEQEAKQQLKDPNAVRLDKIDPMTPGLDPVTAARARSFQTGESMQTSYRYLQAINPELPNVPAMPIESFELDRASLNTSDGVERVADMFLGNAGFTQDPLFFSDPAAATRGSFNESFVDDNSASYLNQLYKAEGGRRETMENWLSTTLTDPSTFWSKDKKAKAMVINKLLGNPPINWSDTVQTGRGGRVVRSAIPQPVAQPGPTAPKMYQRVVPAIQQ